MLWNVQLKKKLRAQSDLKIHRNRRPNLKTSIPIFHVQIPRG